MANHDIVVVGASAGGVEALQTLTSGLPKDLQAAVLVVLHIPPWGNSMLQQILARKSQLPVEKAAHHKVARRGHIYVAAPDHHLLLDKGVMELVRGPKENRHRPAIDVLFRSAALAYGPRVIGVVLTGGLDDGTVGLWQIKSRGGLAVVQDPNDALHPAMPHNAMQNVDVDLCVPLSKMPRELARLVELPAPAEEKYPASNSIKMEEKIVRMEDTLESIKGLGEPSQFTCPECQGTLFELQDGQLVRFRCRTGHAYGMNTLLSEQRSATEDALWAAMRALREKADMRRQMADRKPKGNSQRATLEKQAKQAAKQAQMIRDMIEAAEGHEWAEQRE